jgi:Domain of unknown function (DUF4189)
MHNIPHHIRQANPNQSLQTLRNLTQQQPNVAGAHGQQQQRWQQQEQYYGAIAYSQSTGKNGSSWGYENRAAAERAALGSCSAPDAAIVMWGANCWIALAVGEGGAWGAAWNKDQLTAEREALRFCRQYAQSCQIAEVIASGA